MKQSALRSNTAFSLVELLVVISIVVVLIALLLPSIGQAKESARRAKCLANLHNLHVGAMAYGNDFVGDAPYQWSPGAAGWDSGLSTEEGQYTTFTQNGVTSDTGLKVFGTQKYITTAILVCPSQSAGITLDSSSPGTHFAFRYNSRRTLGYGDSTIIHPNSNTDVIPPPRHLLWGEPIQGSGDPKLSRGWRALFTDAANCRKDDLYNVMYRNVSPYQREWAHKIGGQIITHSGATKWLLNQKSTNSAIPGWPRNWYSQYGCGWTVGIDNFLTQ